MDEVGGWKRCSHIDTFYRWELYDQQEHMESMFGQVISKLGVKVNFTINIITGGESRAPPMTLFARNN